MIATNVREGCEEVFERKEGGGRDSALSDVSRLVRNDALFSRGGRPLGEVKNCSPLSAVSGASNHGASFREAVVLLVGEFGDTVRGGRSRIKVSDLQN